MPTGREHILCCMKFKIILRFATAFWFCSAHSFSADGPKLEYTEEHIRPYLEATTWTVFSLDPDPWVENTADPFAVAPAPTDHSKPAPSTPEPKRKTTPAKEFHDYPILGQHTLSVTPEMRLIITDLDRAGRAWTGGVAACFMPRHGLRVIRDGKTHDLQICYECFTAILYENSEIVGHLFFASPPTLTPNAPNPNALNAIFRKYGVKLPPPPSH